MMISRVRIQLELVVGSCASVIGNLLCNFATMKRSITNKIGTFAFHYDFGLNTIDYLHPYTNRLSLWFY